MVVVTPDNALGNYLGCAIVDSSHHVHPASYSFDDLVGRGLFVDKSLIVKEFMESECGINIVTRPRKWGKSVNLEMIKRFFEVEVSDIGIHRKISQRKNHFLFEGGEMELADGTSRMLRALNIANCSTSMKRLGMIPVILFKLPSAKGKNYKAVEDKLKKEIKDMYASHSYLKVYMGNENNMLNNTEKAQLARYFSRKQLNLHELENGLYHLCKLLYDHFLRKVIILIDEYDAVINHAVENFVNNSDEVQKVLGLLQKVFRGVIKNPYMEKCLVTGTLPFTEDSLFPNSTDVCIHSVLDEKYSQNFGFSELEVDEILKSANLSNFTTVDKMKYWYKGHFHGGKMVYNPLDIMGFVSNRGKILDFWVDSGRVKSLDEYLVTDEAQEDLQRLLDDEGIVKPLSNYEGAPSNEEEFHIFFGIFYRIMVHQGYLNAFNHSESGREYLLRIPNQEIRNALVEYKTDWFCNKHEIMVSEIHDFVGCLITGQLSELRENLLRIFDSFKNLSLKVEKDYHRVMSEILSRLSNHNLIISNRHFEVGKLYHMIVPRSKYQGHSAFVLEYGVLDQYNTSVRMTKQLQSLAQKTLERMDSNVYGPMLVHYKYIDKVTTIAVAFYNKSLELSYKVFKQN
ncbi:hypothetical protein J6590_073328 [Homalodisca vitripennis]|nr:hypothetical protein J6590_073328 [Homalodisca vitripennis]